MTGSTELNKKIADRRRGLTMTQAELAKKLGYTDKSTISKIETGQTKIYTSNLIDIARALDTMPSILLGEPAVPDLNPAMLDANNWQINIKKRRIALNMPQTELAKRTGYSNQGVISQIEKGKTGIPAAKIPVFAKALNTTVDELLTGKNLPTTAKIKSVSRKKTTTAAKTKSVSNPKDYIKPDCSHMLLLLCKNIKRQREKMEISQHRLAKILGYKSASMISRIENGKVDIPAKKLFEISLILKTTPNELIGDSSQE